MKTKARLLKFNGSIIRINGQSISGNRRTTCKGPVETPKTPVFWLKTNETQKNARNTINVSTQNIVVLGEFNETPRLN